VTDEQAASAQDPAQSLAPVLSLILCAGLVASLLAAPGAEGLLGAFLAALMLAIAATDARSYRIPNELTGAAFALALLRASAIGPEAGAEAVLWTALRALAVALPLLALMMLYRRWRGRDGLGLGDIKLAAVAGAWLDLVTVAVAIELAALAAISAYGLNAALRRKPLSATAFLPFGLFLAPAIWLGWLGETMAAGSVVDWLSLWFG
jgi:leader peptidase (prepilin peptidase)/N-methyltransferase